MSSVRVLAGLTSLWTTLQDLNIHTMEEARKVCTSREMGLLRLINQLQITIPYESQFTKDDGTILEIFFSVLIPLPTGSYRCLVDEEGQILTPFSDPEIQQRCQEFLNSVITDTLLWLE